MGDIFFHEGSHFGTTPARRDTVRLCERPARQHFCGPECLNPGGGGQTARPEEIPPSLVSWPLSSQGVLGTKRGMIRGGGSHLELHKLFQVYLIL